MKHMFGLPVHYIAAFTLVDEPIELWDGCVDITAYAGDLKTVNELFQDMLAWIRDPDTLSAARDVDNEMAVMTTACNGKHLIIAFDLGGSDNCSYQLTEFAAKRNIGIEDMLSKSHAHTVDIQRYCGMDIKDED